jgi:hypothetical protein
LQASNSSLRTPAHPDAPKGCDGWDAETEAYMSKLDGLTAFVCVDNSPYWLAGLPDPGAGENCHIEDSDLNTCETTNTLPLLPGADQLRVGNSPSGGVTVTDLGIRSTGFTNFPVCSGKTAFVNWGITKNKQNMDIYPCDTLKGDNVHCDEGNGWPACA